MPTSPWDPSNLVSPALTLWTNSTAPGLFCERWHLVQGPCPSAVNLYPLSHAPSLSLFLDFYSFDPVCVCVFGHVECS